MWYHVFMNKSQALLKEAESEARKVATWADLSNFLCDPEDGIVARAYPTRAEREALVGTAEYKQIRRLLSEARARTGLVAGATPQRKSGRFVVRLPQSLHAALEREAKAEGISPNQLVVAKLSLQLGAMLQKVEAVFSGAGRDYLQSSFYQRPLAEWSGLIGCEIVVPTSLLVVTLFMTNLCDRHSGYQPFWYSRLHLGRGF